MLVALLAALVLYCLAVWNDWMPWLRGWHEYPSGWTWPTFDFPPQERYLPVLASIVAMWVVILAAETMSRVARKAAIRRVIVGVTLAGMIVLGYTLQMGLFGLKANNANALLFQRITSRHFTSYFAFGVDTPNVQRLFSGYLHSITNCLHCQGHPPGPSFFYWVDAQAVSLLPAQWQHDLASSVYASLGDDPRVTSLRYTLNDTQTISAYLGGALMLLIASAIVVPLFGLARWLGPPGYEFRLAGLGLAIPGLMLMAPEFDQVFATIAATVLYMGLQGLATTGVPNAGLWAAGAGIALAVGVFFTWGLGMLLVPLALLCLAGVFWSREALFNRQVDWRPVPTVQGVAWGAGLAAGSALLLSLIEVVAQPNLIAIFQYNMKQVALHEAERPYWVWIYHGPIDFLQFLGLPLALLALFSLVVRPWERRHEIQEPQTKPLVPWYTRLNVYALAFWLVLAIIELTGRTKGEQGRILVFVMPLALLAVYFWVGRQPRRWVVTALFFAQMAVCVVIGARWFVP